jgi:hypothetical protein
MIRGVLLRNGARATSAVVPIEEAQKCNIYRSFSFPSFLQLLDPSHLAFRQ